MSSGTLIVLGSNELEEAKRVEFYNPKVDEWTRILNLNIDRTHYKSIMLEEKLMIVGGSKDGKNSSTVESYDYLTGKMATHASFKHPRISHVVAVLARHLYVLAGTDNTEITNSVERYNFLTNTWSDVLPMPTARSSPGTAVLYDEIYVIGGYGTNPDRRYLTTVESFNAVTEKWKVCTPMNDERDDPAVATVGNVIFAVGGRGFNGFVNSVERYEPFIDRWTFMHDISVPRRRCVGLYFDDSLFIVGGENDDAKSLSTVECYNTVNNTWTTKTPLATPRADFSLVEVPWHFVIQAIALNGEGVTN